MKIQTYFVILFLGILLVGCSDNNNEQTADDISLSEFIIGKWRAENDNQNIYGEYHEEYFIKFINKRRLLFCNKKPIEPFCIFCTYKQIDKNVVFVTNPRMVGGEWFLTKNENELNICLWEENNCLQFTRDASSFDFKLEVFGIMR